jgi:hypothetical protein
MTSVKKVKENAENPNANKRRTRGNSVGGKGAEQKDKKTKASRKDDSLHGADTGKNGTADIQRPKLSGGRPVKRQALIDHIETVLNEYGLVVVHASATVGTVRTCMLTRDKIIHNKSTAEFVDELDDCILKFVEKNKDSQYSIAFDVLSGLMYYCAIIHADLLGNNSDYQKVADAASDVLANLMGGGQKPDAGGYESETGFDDPSVR